MTRDLLAERAEAVQACMAAEEAACIALVDWQNRERALVAELELRREATKAAKRSLEELLYSRAMA